MSADESKSRDKLSKPGKKRLKVKKNNKNIEEGQGPYSKILKETLEEKKDVDERLIHASLVDEATEIKSNEPDEISQRDERIYYLSGKGKRHPVHNMQQRIREVLLNSGFNELENQYFVPEKDIFEQYDTKSGLVLNETYYLGETKRIEVAVTTEQLSKLEEIFLHSDFDKKIFSRFIHDYNNNEIDLAQFFQKLKDELGFSNVDLNHLIEEIPELKNAIPHLTSITLRSKMDLSWLPTLKAIMDKDNLPNKVFSTGLWFKREPKQDELYIKSHYGASCIIMDDDINLDIGKIIVEEILDLLEIKEIEIKSNEELKEFKINQKELNFFSYDISIATCGLFSKKILAKFGIEIPVLYINFGLEHLVMAEEGMDDIHELMYPQFHSAWKLNDIDIAKSIQLIQIPKTEIGKEIATNLYNICQSKSNTPSPCEFVVWEGLVGSKLNTSDEKSETQTNEDPSEDHELSSQAKKLIVKVIKKDKGNKLCGPAALNEIVVKNGDIYGIQNPDQNTDFTGAVKAKFNYLNAFSNYVGSEIEKKLEEGGQNQAEQLKQINAGIIKEMEDINLELDGRAIRFITTNNKMIDVRGPMFVNVEYKFESKIP